MAGNQKKNPLVKEMEQVIDNLDDTLKRSFQNMHGGYPEATLVRFLKARDDNVPKASKMLIDCLNWRVKNDIDNVLARPIKPKETWDAIRESQLVGFCGYCKKGRPVFAIGVGQSSYDKAAVDKYVHSHIQINEYRDTVLVPEISKKRGRYVGTCLKILDMTGLKLSAFSRLKTSTVIATVDDLNYPEKTDIYFIVNAPLVFSTCWKAVKPMLQERTKRKVQVLKGNGREELLQFMDYDSLPMFCKIGAREGSSNSLMDYGAPTSNVFSPEHQFHVEVYRHIKENSCSLSRANRLNSEGSMHIQVPSLDEQDEPTETGDFVNVLERILPSLQSAQNAQDQQRVDQLATKMEGIQVST
ncbi:hypothetical protein BDL97_06G030700 [Sphagnum fallax]|nr:hypothetical protein BDL97_06G030700 [Sphagnum fallax]